MRIHVVQKGDTLWKIAKKYDVDRESLKKMNSQLTSPESLKPGMKVKVPTGGVPVKRAKPAQETARSRKETRKPVKKTAEKSEASGATATSQASPAIKEKEEETSRASQTGAGNWSFHYPLDEWPGNWSMNEAPESANEMPNLGAMGTEPMMPGYPNPVSPAQYGPYGMPPEAVSPYYGANPLYPEQMAPGYYGANPYPNVGQYGTGMYPESVYPWPQTNPTYPEYVSPAYAQPGMMPMHPLSSIPAGSECHCGEPLYGYPYLQEGGMPYMPYMPQPTGVSPQMTGMYQPEYWEPSNAGGFYGMMPAGTRTDSES